MLAHQHLQVQQVQSEGENDKTRRYAELVQGISVRPGFTIPLGVLERTRAERTRAQQRMKTSRSSGSCGFVDGMISPPGSPQSLPADTIEVREEESVEEFYAAMARKEETKNVEMAAKENNNEIEDAEMAAKENNENGNKDEIENAKMAAKERC